MQLEQQNGWEYLPLESVIDYYIGGDWGKDESYVDENYSLVQCIRGAEYKRWEEEKGKTASFRKIKTSSLANRELQEGDILVEISGGGPEQPVGRTVLIDKSVLAFNSQIPKVCSNFLRLVRPAQSVIPKFLNLYLKLFYNSGEVTKYQAGSNNLRNLKFTDYLKIPIPIPTIGEQEQIVSKIEELFSELDKGIESLKTAQQQLKVYRQSVLKWAFEGKLTNDNVKDGELPEGWKLLKLKELFRQTPQNGLYKPASDYGSGTPIIRIDGFYEGRILADYQYKRVCISESEEAKYLIEVDDILVNRVNSLPYLGKCGHVKHVNEPTVFESNIMRVKINSDIAFPSYVSSYLTSKKGLSELRKNAKHAVNQASINQSDVGNAIVPLPPPSEQKAVVAEIESRFSVADKLDETINQSLQQAETLRQSILKKAFEGRLVVQPAKKVYKPKSEYFYQAQILGFINKYSKEKGISHGEMTIAKYAYLADKVYGIPTYYNYQRWHLGPYPPEMKKAIKNSKYFVQKKGLIELANEESLLKYNNPYKEQVQAAIEDLATIFSKCQGSERSDKTELLATVCKVIEDIKSTDLAVVRQSMKEWPIELKGSRYKNKAEKFSDADTKRCLKFIVERGWDKKLCLS